MSSGPAPQQWYWESLSVTHTGGMVNLCPYLTSTDAQSLSIRAQFQEPQATCWAHSRAERRLAWAVDSLLWLLRSHFLCVPQRETEAQRFFELLRVSRTGEGDSLQFHWPCALPVQAWLSPSPSLLTVISQSVQLPFPQTRQAAVLRLLAQEPLILLSKRI